MSRHLLHDTAWAAATTVLEVFEPCLRPVERRDAFTEVYDRVLAALEVYTEQLRREAARLTKPSWN